jgi:outer membrane protein TolC
MTTALRGATRACLILTAIVFTAAEAPCEAEEQTATTAAPTMTLADALSYARDHQPQIRAILAELKAKRSEARIPRAAWLPQVGATAQLIYGTANNTTASSLNVPEVDLPRIGASKSVASGSWSPHASTLAALSVSQELYDFGRIAAQMAVADAQVEVARANRESVELDVQLGVEEAFHAVLAAHQVLFATEEAYRRAVTHRDFAQAGVKSGLRPPIDLTRAQADVARLDVRRIRAQTGLAATKAALAASIGSDALEVDARPLAIGESPAPALGEVLRVAGEKNPLVIAALARVRARRSTTRSITGELLPNLFATAGLSGRAGGTAPSSGEIPYGDGWLPDVANWHLGAVLEWNLFDGTVLARRAASRAREEAAEADLAAARLSITLGAERAYLDLDAASRVLPGLEETVTAARANEAQASARFKAGLGNIVELADAETLLVDASLELAIGRFTIARARAALGRVMAEHLIGTP